MKYEIKLYYYHDLDLVMLHKSGAISIRKAAAMALDAYARGDVSFCICPGEPRRELRNHKSYRIMVELDDDSPAGEMVAGIKEGYRNNFTKMVIRKYLSGEMPLEFLSGAGEIGFDKASTAFLKGKKPVHTWKSAPKPARQRLKPENGEIKQADGYAGEDIPQYGDGEETRPKAKLKLEPEPEPARERDYAGDPHGQTGPESSYINSAALREDPEEDDAGDSINEEELENTLLGMAPAF